MIFKIPRGIRSRKNANIRQQDFQNLVNNLPADFTVCVIRSLFRKSSACIHLTIVQSLAITGAVVVTTPQEVSLAAAIKGVNMFVNEKVGVPILGVVENMAWFTPAELPGNKYYIFGKEGGKRMAEALNIPLIGQIPLVQSICESGDAGIPIAMRQETPDGQAFMQVAAALVANVDRRNSELPETKIVGTHK